jgi:hypothetical protein
VEYKDGEALSQAQELLHASVKRHVIEGTAIGADSKRSTSEAINTRFDIRTIEETNTVNSLSSGMFTILEIFFVRIHS